MPQLRASMPIDEATLGMSGSFASPKLSGVKFSDRAPTPTSLSSYSSLGDSPRSSLSSPTLGLSQFKATVRAIATAVPPCVPSCLTRRLHIHAHAYQAIAAAATTKTETNT